MTGKTDVMTIVYAAVSGEYSDYRVDRLFTDRPLAERYVETVGGEVEEFHLHAALPAEPRTLYTMEYFLFLPQHDRQLPSVVHESSKAAFPGVNGPLGARPVVDIDVRETSTYGHARNITVTGYNQDHVRQAFSDAVVAETAKLEALPRSSKLPPAAAPTKPADPCADRPG